jgi:Tfp pilus assembly protein PilX
MRAYSTRSRSQAGSTLLVSIIMLVLLTLFVLSAINSSTINLRIAGNTQALDEARAVAQQGIEQFVSSYANFYPTPASVPSTSVTVNNATYQYSIATAACISARPQNPPNPLLLQCANGVKSGVFCWDTTWQVTAVATDTRSGASQSVTQGVSITFPPAFVPASAGC